MVSKNDEWVSEVYDDIRCTEDIIRPVIAHVVLRHLIVVTFLGQIMGGHLAVLKPQARHRAQIEHQESKFLWRWLGFKAGWIVLLHRLE